METIARIETALQAALTHAEAPEAPPLLAQAMRHAVFPGGARIRPQLCLAVAKACGDDRPALTDAAAAAIELLHCGSLVHDDLPCFDDAGLRRGVPSVHSAFGEPLAVLAGDALIVLAFEEIARAGRRVPERIAPVLLTVSASVGMPGGIIGGQAWESEPDPDLEAYQQAKTGALFMAATMTGAAAAGAETAPWRGIGDWLGKAYQIADDIRDAVADEDEVGKPVGQDVLHDRPNAVQAYGLEGAMTRLSDLVTAAAESVPDCVGAEDLRALVRLQATRLVPKKLAQSAA